MLEEAERRPINNEYVNIMNYLQAVTASAIVMTGAKGSNRITVTL